MVNARLRFPKLAKLIVLVVLVVVASAAAWTMMIRMPGESYQGPLPPATDELRALKHELQSHVQTLASDIGKRNLFPYDKLITAAKYIQSTLADAGYDV